MSTKPRLRCAVYTRKSSDEGLDQAFNSLDAQREAGEAYIKSQASEGWRAIATRYDDGGFSGGNMDRPALVRLLADVDAGHINVIVVYKIDRLTRSLADFARIVERLDARNVSFVSVTQAFNTTTSMGRLTLNVLLSFAQFEREVTGERIRDKIAASKAKGMWMGGVPPLGYDIPASGTHVLRINDAEAVTVRHIFARYLALRSVHRLAEELARDGITSKRRTTGAGNMVGGVPLSRGALFHMLKNRIYLGQISHKGAHYNGQHEPIITLEQFDNVQVLIASQTRRRGEKRQQSFAFAQLTGRIFDANGRRMSPTHVRGKNGKLYRYYVSAPLQQGTPSNRGTVAPALQRLSATNLEEAVDAALTRILPEEAHPVDRVARIEVHRRHLNIQIKAQKRALTGTLAPDEILVREPDAPGVYSLTLPITLSRTGGKTIITGSQPRRSRRDPTMIAALRRAHTLVTRDASGPNLTAAPTSQYGRRLATLALLAPDIQRDILAGRQPHNLTLSALMADELPIDWAQQRQHLGFGTGLAK